MKTTQTLTVSGMSCGSCVAKIQTRLLEHPTISGATVRLEPPTADISSIGSLEVDSINEWLRPLGHYSVTPLAPKTEAQPVLATPSATTYKPLLILLGYLVVAVAAACVASGRWDWHLAMRLFMGGFFVAFSFFKMLDLRGFADAYRSYDIVARAFPIYGWIYPFIELTLGLGYLANVSPFFLNLATALVMVVSLVGVLRSVLSKTVIRCACLGTVFNLPMSTVTVIEDGLMLGMALAMLLL